MEDEFVGKLIGVNTVRAAPAPEHQHAATSTDDMWREWSRRPRISYDRRRVRRSDARRRRRVVDANFCSDRVAAELRRHAATRHRAGRAPSRRTSTSRTSSSPTAGAFAAAGSAARAAGGRHRPRDRRAAASRASIRSGENLRIGGLPYRVIGVAETQGSACSASRSTSSSSCRSPRRRTRLDLHRINVHRRAHRPGARHRGTMTEAMEEVRASMRSRRHLRPVRRTTSRWRPPRRRSSSGTRSRASWCSPARPAGDRAGRGRHRDHEHHAGGRGRAHARDRHPQGARRPAARHPGAVPGRVGDAVHRRRGDRHRAGHRAGLRGRGAHAAARRGGALVDRARRRGRGRRRHRRRGLPGQPRRAARPDRRPAGRSEAGHEHRAQPGGRRHRPRLDPRQQGARRPHDPRRRHRRLRRDRDGRGDHRHQPQRQRDARVGGPEDVLRAALLPGRAAHLRRLRRDVALAQEPVDHGGDAELIRQLPTVQAVAVERGHRGPGGLRGSEPQGRADRRHGRRRGCW